METLYEIGSFIRTKSNLLDQFVHSSNDRELIALLDIVYENKGLIDHEAMIKVYGSPKPSSFSKLKGRLKNLMLQTFSYLKISWESSDARVNRYISIVNNSNSIMNMFNSLLFKPATALAEKEINEAIRYEVTASVISLSKMLTNYYGVNQFNMYKYKKYLNILNKHLFIQEYEILSEIYYIELQNTQFISLASPSSKIIDLSKKYMQELSSLNIETFVFKYNLLRIKTIYFEFIHDYKNILFITDDFLKNIDRSLISKQRIGNINIRKLSALIMAGTYELAINEGFTVLKSTQRASNLWFLLVYYIIKAQLYLGEYFGAMQLMKSAFDNPKISSLNSTFFEMFNITLGYLTIINSTDLIEKAFDDKGLPPFRISKFLNEIPNYSKDKRGINVSILLMHITFLLQRKDFGKIIDRVDALKFYAYRHLRKDDTFRSNCMIKMVVQMAKADFHPVRTERYTEDLFRQLQEVKLAGSGQNIETEIIPYEVLWDIMKKALR